MNYRIEQWPAFTVAGFKVPMKTEETFEKVPQLWKAVWEDGRIQRLHEVFKQADYRPEGFLGVSVGGIGSASDMVDYYVAVTTDVDVPDVKKVEAPEGMEEYHVPAATWVIIEANGDPFAVMQPLLKSFYRDWLPSSGYKLADLPTLESYMMDNRQNIWVPVEKA